jgi:hypothetical protein
MSKTYKDLVQFKAKQDGTTTPKPRKHGGDTSASKYRSVSGSQVLSTALGETTKLWDTCPKAILLTCC